MRFTSPLWGEVAPKARVRGRGSIEGPYPLTPTLSPWERELAADAAIVWLKTAMAQRPSRDRRGLSASFKPSPMRLSASTDSRMASPGNTVIHHAWRMTVRPAPTM